MYDVEHGGDIDEITDLIHSNGGKILHLHHEYEEETLYITYQVPDYESFKKAVLESNSNVFFQFREE
jgi:hypothetical protein